MAQHKAPNSACEVLKALNEFLLPPEEDVITMPLEQVHAELEAEGINPTPLINDVRTRLTKMKADQDLAEARQKRERLLDLREKLARVPSSLRDQIVDRVRNLPASQVAMAYRKLEQATDADVQTLAEELLMLDKMDEDDSSQS